MTQPCTKGKSVLIVEDEPLICRVCQKVLVSEGFDVDIAENGTIAKTMVGLKHYDICFSDIRTPQMNGIELYYYFAGEYPELAKGTIFTTGDVLSNKIKQFLAESNQPFLSKPFTPNELRSVVKKAVDQWEQEAGHVIQKT